MRDCWSIRFDVDVCHVVAQVKCCCDDRVYFKPVAIAIVFVAIATVFVAATTEIRALAIAMLVGMTLISLLVSRVYAPSCHELT